MNIALYLRVSTDKQETENQAMVLREFAAKQGWVIVHEYCDYESGSKSDRVAFKQMFADAAQRIFDLVMFWALAGCRAKACSKRSNIFAGWNLTASATNPSQCVTGSDAIITDQWFSYTALGQPSDVYESTPNSGGYYHTRRQYYLLAPRR